MLLLVPSDPLNPRRPDEHFAAEAAAARDLGLDVAVVDHEAILDPSSASALGSAPSSDDAVYRGWMLRSEQYERFHRLADARGIRLRTGAAAYRRAHELPGWYAAFERHTPLSAWTDSPSLDAFRRRCSELPPGPAVLRDFVKSMKHYWAEAAFIPAVEDAVVASAVATRFLELRDEDLVGGLVVRQYEEFRGAEVRTWWLDGECRLVTAHPDDPDAHPPDGIDPDAVAGSVRAVESPFVTVDFAPRADGAWRVVEVGDGQVSDRPSSTAAGDLIAALARR